MAHQARKRFGQHFLVDESVIDHIVRVIDPQPDDFILEIGPGMSAITRPVLARVKHLHVVEIDHDLVRRLRSTYSPDVLTVHEADALDFDFAQLAAEQGDKHGKFRLIGNLPYNISSPLMFHLMRFADLVRDQHFMLQKEVVDRMVAKPGSHNNGRLSIMLQLRYKMISLFDVAPESFDPPPKVMSSIVRMLPLDDLRPKPKNEGLFNQIVAQAFCQRRKMLRRSLAQWAIDFAALDIPETARAEELGVRQFIAIADQVDQTLA